MPSKKHYFKVYVSEEDKFNIQAAAAERKISVSKYILSKIRGETKERKMVTKPDRSLSAKEIQLRKIRESRKRRVNS